MPSLLREHILPGHVPEQPVLSEKDTVVTLGSCFAQELKKVLELARFGSDTVWVPSGLNNTYALLDFVSWAITGATTHRGFRYERTADGEIAEWAPQQEQAVFAEHFARAGVFVFTIGLAEVWKDTLSGCVFWRGVPEAIYDEGRHVFLLSTVEENAQNIREIVRVVDDANPADADGAHPLAGASAGDVPGRLLLHGGLRFQIRASRRARHLMSERPENVYYWPSFEVFRWAMPSFSWRAFDPMRATHAATSSRASSRASWRRSTVPSAQQRCESAYTRQGTRTRPRVS